jgi:exopolysaccharide production protein ExoQ
MPPFAAICLCLVIILWLFARDAKSRDGFSAALWIPLTWAFIICTRPVSLWLGVSVDPDAALGIQDKLVDKVLFLLLITAGLFVLLKRQVNWSAIVRHNKWLFAYFLYLGVSIVWADDSFVSFKRWIKDAGNVVMVLVVLSDKDASEAIKALLARCAYLVLPLSVVVIKYYTEFSRHYDPWTNQPVFTGLTLDKNYLGSTLFVCALFLSWMLLENMKAWAKERTTLFVYCGLLLMTIWLLHKARSATAVCCTVLGVGVLVAMRVPRLRIKVQRLEAHIVWIAVILILLQVSGLGTSVLKGFAEAVGRDPKLHGRAEIWEGVLKEDINPLVGTGFYSFWSPERNGRISKELGFYYNLGEAHNGYIETYLNSGLIGLALLFIVIGAGVKAIKRAVLDVSRIATLRLAFLVSILIYNITESAFDRLSMLWLTLLLVMLDYPWETRQKQGRRSEKALSEDNGIIASAPFNAMFMTGSGETQPSAIKSQSLSCAAQESYTAARFRVGALMCIKRKRVRTRWWNVFCWVTQFGKVIA